MTKKVADFQCRREEIMMMTVLMMFLNDSDYNEGDKMAGGMTLVV